MRNHFLPVTLLLTGTALSLAAGFAQAVNYPAGGNVSGMSISKNPVPAGESFKFIVNGTGHCKIAMQGFPDAAYNPMLKSSGNLPVTFTTSLSKPGTYQVSVDVSRDSLSSNWCTGAASATLTVTAALPKATVALDLVPNPMHDLAVAGPPKLAVPDQVGQYGASVKLRAVLTNGGGQGLPNSPVVFKVAGAAAGNASTGPDGSAVVDYTVPDTLPLGSNVLNAQSGNLGVAGRLTIRKGSSQLSLEVPPYTGAGAALLLHGTLGNANQGNAPLAGRTIVIKVGGKVVASPVTNAQGGYAYDYTLPNSGRATFGAEFGGDDHYQASSAGKP